VSATLAAAPVRAAQAAPRQTAAAKGVSRVLSAGQAMRRARATRRPVTVSALTTATSVTVARPDGRFAVTESARPVRARRDGRWQNLNPDLRRNPNRTLSPELASSALTLSGGGNGPLVVMNSAARSLSLSWPYGTLPAPTISGATATYPDVFPGVDLAVTASAQGGASDVLIVKNAAAAANPALASLQLTAIATPSLTLTASDGAISAAASPQGTPVFSTSAPLAWDSTPPPASMPTTINQDGVLVDAQSGLPADSTAAAPGAAAHLATVPVSVTGDTITLSPPASALTGTGTVYPVYIDPTWWPAGSGASAWTQVDKGYPTANYWKESSDLQSGDCDFSGCADVEVARSFLRLPIPSQLTSTSVINSAYLYTTDEWSSSCTKTSVRLYTTGGISSATTWNNQPTWASSYSYQDASFGHSGCNPPSGYYKDDLTWNVTSAIKNAVGHQATQTWGIRAADETSDQGWKQFFSGASSNDAPHMTVYYDDPPNHPGRSTSPGGSCQYPASNAPIIGNDDVTFYAAVSDDSDDNNLTTRFLILNASGGTVYDSSTQDTSVTTGNNATAQLTLTRAEMQGLGGGSTAATYHWYAMTTNEDGLTNSMPADECYFTYNPAGPTAPQVTVPSSGVLGQQVTAIFQTPGCGPASNPCPAKYTYQIGAGTPQVATPDDSGYWTGPITIPWVGSTPLNVYGIASNGNLSETATQRIAGTAPASPYADGDFNGDGKPDLLTLGSGSTPGLWLSPSNGSGILANAADIGGAGTGLNQSTGADGPGDWAGAEVLHGDFTGNHVQDAMAYYPSGSHAGEAVILAGTGDGSPLRPLSGSSWTLGQYTFLDPVTGDTPSTLLAAGNASQAGIGTADLIGIAGDSTNNYTLDLFTNIAGDGPTGYGFNNYVLSAQSPDGATPSDWNNFQLATAQPGGSPAATVLFALDTTTGALYESTNPSPGTGCGSYTPPTIPATCTLIGTPQSTWTTITHVPWGASPPTLLSADINSAGQTELWTSSGATTVTAYTVAGTTVSTEHTGSLTQPLDDWPLAEGSGTTTADTVTGQNATLTGGATWITGDDTSQFVNHIALDGTGYVSPPATAIPSGSKPPQISIWFKTTTPGGVLVSMQQDPLSSGPALPAEYDPVLYVGTDGKLYGEWWNHAAAPVSSSTPVDDGIWHHAVLAGGTTSQTLTLDGAQQSLTGATEFQFTPTNLAFGAGYIGGGWPDEPNYKKTDSSDYRWYFTGDIADVTYSYPGGS
jgi:hypothetical protein